MIPIVTTKQGLSINSITNWTLVVGNPCKGSPVSWRWEMRTRCQVNRHTCSNRLPEIDNKRIGTTGKGWVKLLGTYCSCLKWETKDISSSAQRRTLGAVLDFLCRNIAVGQRAYKKGIRGEGRRGHLGEAYGSPVGNRTMTVIRATI